MKFHFDPVLGQVTIILETPKEFDYFRQIVVGQFKPSVEVDKFAGELDAELTGIGIGSHFEEIKKETDAKRK